MHKTLVSIVIGAALCVTGSHAPAQSPAAAAADPGPLSVHPSGLTLPAGYEATQLINLSGSAALLASLQFGPGGDLYFTDTVGTFCAPAATTHVFRLAMNGDAVAPGATPQPFTTMPIDGHRIVYDPVTDALYASGTCDQTGSVWRIPPSGAPELLNPNNPLNDPDGVAIGTLPGATGPQLLVPAQDALWAFDLDSGPVPTATQVSVDLSQTGAAALGNWSFPVWDRNTASLIATNVGRPTTRLTVEITFTSATTATAQVIGPDSLDPLLVDQQGVRFWRDLADLSILNPQPGGAAPRSVVSNIALDFEATGGTTPGTLLVVDPTTNDLFRIDRPLTIDRLEMSASLGGFAGIQLNAPTARFSEGYMIFASASGSSPGAPFGPVTVPLNPDFTTQVGMVLAVLNHFITPNWIGFLDANGQASAGFKLDPGLVPPGLTFNFCFLLGNPEYASNAVWIHITP